jgi:dipeptidyl aminopeptidase/acylaminoacyl peptidase
MIPSPRAARLVPVAGLIAGLACGRETDHETVYTMHPPTWFEDGWSYYDVSSDGTSALFGARFGVRLIDLARREEDAVRLHAGLEGVSGAVFDGDARLVRLGVDGGEVGWFVEQDDSVAPVALPGDADPWWSPDGTAVAYGRSSTPDIVYLRTAGGVREVEAEGSITGFGWSPQSDVLYTVMHHDDGLSSLLRIGVSDGEMRVVHRGLDAPVWFNSVGVAADGERLYLALAGDQAPDPAARHDPHADRDTDIYELDLAMESLRPVVRTPGDDFHPMVIDGYLYWTHNEVDDAVAVVPAAGGAVRVVVEDAQIPYWSHDGRRLGYTYGGWRIADWALNLDAAVVEVDGDGNPVGDPRPIVVGYHEDFTPSWSPDGRWIAYHSHRSDSPVAAYVAEGASDDIYLRRPDAPMDEEIRLTDFGWEVGMADWSPDGTRLVFDSWDRGAPGVSKPWVATIDPATGSPDHIERLALPPGFHGTLLESWSPGGDEIALVERIEGEQQALWVVGADGDAFEKLLEFRASTYGGIDWTPDGQHLVYAALSGGRMQLFSVPRAGGTPRQLTRDEVGLIHPQVSPDGRWIAATRPHRSKELRRRRL